MQENWFTLILGPMMVFGPVVGYLPQYQSMEKRKSSEGFSRWVCGLLLWSNTLRVFFWLGRRFETTLLWQAVVMVVAQLLLLELCVRLPYGPSSSSPPVLSVSPSRQSPFSLLKVFRNKPALNALRNPNQFWAWRDFHTYLLFMICYILLLTFLQLVLGHFQWYMELTGFVSLLLESAIGLPQLIQQWQHRSSKGLSRILLATWFLGDAFKTMYYLQTDAPLQFLMCGIIQLSVDMLLLLQMVAYQV